MTNRYLKFEQKSFFFLLYFTSSQTILNNRVRYSFVRFFDIFSIKLTFHMQIVQFVDLEILIAFKIIKWVKMALFFFK